MKLTIQLAILSVVNIGIAFAFQLYLLSQLGAGMESDAFFSGMTIPRVALLVVSGSLSNVLVPLLANQEEQCWVNRNAWAFLILISGVFCIISIVLYIAASWWVPLTVPGFTDEGQKLTIELSRIQLIGMVFFSINTVQLATYRAKKQFIRAEFLPIISAIISMLLLAYFLPKYGVVAAAWIVVFQTGSTVILLSASMGKPVWPDFRNPVVSIAWRRIKPLLYGNMYYKTDIIIDRFLLSAASSGSLSLYFLAQQIYGAISQVMSRAIIAPLIPSLSNIHKNNDNVKLWSVYRKELIKLILICGVAVIFIVTSYYAFSYITAYKAVSIESIHTLWWFLIWLIGMFVGGMTGQLTSSTFYARGNTSIPVKIGMVTYTIYIPCKVMMFYLYGVMGLALTTSFYVVVDFVLLFYILKRDIRSFS